MKVILATYVLAGLLPTWVQGFVPLSLPSNRHQGRDVTQPSTQMATLTTALQASSSNNQEFFKAGLLANVEEEAALLASRKIRSIQDLGWSGPAKRRGKTRPRHWAFGGAGEKSIQDKPNYDPDSPLCVESWLSLADFYQIVQDDTAVADTIFVALAKGGAYIEREVAEQVLARWRPKSSATTTTKDTRKTAFPRFPSESSTAASTAFDTKAFLQTVQEGRQEFLLGWAAFVTLTGVAVAGIVFPTNPLQLALVDLLEVLTHTDARLAEQAAAAAAAAASFVPEGVLGSS